jgi:hypothetical protein
VDGFKIDFAAFKNKASKPAAVKVQETAAEEPRDERAEENARTVKVFKTWDVQKKMRIMSEAKLDEVLDWHMEPGTAYHAISFGDVDSLSYIRHIVKQQRIRYAMVSTWCMAKCDAEEMLTWAERGDVERFDFYVGELFKNGYRGCLDILDKICERTGGRVARVRNHSKLVVFIGERFSGSIESSANLDTNPRIEQTCITIDRGVAEFYKSFFDQMVDYDGRYKDWKPWTEDPGKAEEE